MDLFAPLKALRAALTPREVFESALTTVAFCFVDHHEYFDFDATRAVPAEWLEDGTLIEVLHGVGCLRFLQDYTLT